MREGGFVVGGVIGLRGTVYCWLGAMEVASDPFVDSAVASRTVMFDRCGDKVERLERLEGFFSSVLDLEDDLWTVRVDEDSFSGLDDDDFDLGVSARVVLLDFVPSSLLERRLDDDLLTSALILMLDAFFFVFSFSLSLSDALSSSPTAGLPLREVGWSLRPVKGGLGGALGFSARA